MSEHLDLNKLEIWNEDGPDNVPIRPGNTSRADRVTRGASVEVVFDNIAGRMVEFIKSKPVIVGCVAWLTNKDILDALATRDEVSIIVQKEDFLRPDSGGWSVQKIKAQYQKIRGADRGAAGPPHYSYAGDLSIAAIRCAGIAKDRREVPPRMHHKFLVACDAPQKADDGERWWSEYVPTAVWTGSFNATENATKSLENAIIIDDAAVAGMFFHEWKMILGISEPLDWTSRYVNPEYRIGT